MQNKQITTQSGRKLYRHVSDQGTVLEFKHNDQTHKVLVLDVKYSKYNVQWSTDNKAVPGLTQYKNKPFLIDGIEYSQLLTCANDNIEDYRNITDDYLCSIMPWCDANSSTYNTQCMSKCNSCVDAIVGYVNSINIDGYQAAIPNIQILIRMYIERGNLQQLDPSTNEDGITWDQWNFGDWKTALSSTECSSELAWNMSVFGRVFSCGGKDGDFYGVAPIVELL